MDKFTKGIYHTSKFYLEFNKKIIKSGAYYYYSQSISNFLKNDTKVSEDGSFHSLNSTETELEALIPLYATIHEGIHLAHDFSLGSEYVRDFLFDVISDTIRTDIIQNRMSFPVSKYGRDAKKVWELVDEYNAYFGNVITDSSNLTVTDILESYTFAKTYHIISMFKSINNISMKDLEENIYSPYKIKGKNTYKKAFDIYPTRNLGESQTALIGFLFLCDIALHIPPTPLIHCYVKERGFKFEHFSPTQRFLDCIDIINQNKGFPDAEPGKKFYVTLFDFIANAKKWPNFEETQSNWKYFFQLSLKSSFVISNMFKAEFTQYRSENANDFVRSDPGYYFHVFGLPLLLKYSDDNSDYYEYCQIVGNACFPDTELHMPNFLDPYIIMEKFYNILNFERYKKMVFENRYNEAKIMFKFPYLREIYSRIICKEFYQAAINGAYFCCPIKNFRCKASSPSCSELYQLNNLPIGCSLKLWLEDCKINPNFISWRN